ncbi:MAG: ferredoxin reductase family protein [Pseudolabrys sp.]|nr:ferredoxin reductase family protein [Pseudolabrys sp.]
MQKQPPAETTASGAGETRLPSGLPPLMLFAFYGLLCLFPVFLALLQGHPARNIFRELSSGLVMVGYVMTLLQFVLSGRFEWISGRIGIDRTMRFHQVTAWAILAFVLVHPFLYAAPRLYPEPMDAVNSLQRMFASPNLRSGVIAWYLMILIVLLGVFRDRLPFRYELWRLSHGLFAIAIALFGTAHTLRVGTYSADPWLAGFWIVATAVAVAAMLHIYLLKPLLKRSAPYRVVSNRKVADRMWEVAVEPDGGPAMAYAAGQFVWLNLGHSAFSLTEHPFSISSAPAERPRIAFTIKESGDFTGHIGDIAVGTRAYLDGPHGNFILAGREAKGAVLIAGGVGFAPIMGILRQLKTERYPHPLRLIYGNRVESQILYRDEIEALKKELDLQVHYVLSEPPPGWAGIVGELSADRLNACLDAIGGGDWLYFVCGPAPMMNSVERTLLDRGVPRGRIVSERFKYD